MKKFSLLAIFDVVTKSIPCVFDAKCLAATRSTSSSSYSTPSTWYTIYESCSMPTWAQGFRHIVPNHVAICHVPQCKLHEVKAYPNLQVHEVKTYPRPQNTTSGNNVDPISSGEKAFQSLAGKTPSAFSIK